MGQLKEQIESLKDVVKTTPAVTGPKIFSVYGAGSLGDDHTTFLLDVPAGEDFVPIADFPVSQVGMKFLNEVCGADDNCVGIYTLELDDDDTPILVKDSEQPRFGDIVVSSPMPSDIYVAGYISLESTDNTEFADCFTRFNISL